MIKKKDLVKTFRHLEMSLYQHSISKNKLNGGKQSAKSYTIRVKRLKIVDK